MFKIIYTGLIIILSFLAALLFFEYISLRQQVSRIVEIQEEYQTYTTAFRKVLRDYQRLKEGEEEVASDEDDEKKKEQPFLILNREPQYLRDSAVRYLRKNHMDSSLARVYEGDEFISAEPRLERRKRGRYRQQRRGVRRGMPRRGSSLVSHQLAQQRALMRSKVPQDISFVWPIDRSSFWISSFYGSRRKPDRTWGFHHGIDLAAIKGTPVKAAGSGIVVEAGVNKGYGNTVVIMHNNKYRTRYAHLHRIYVRSGKQVEQGQVIGAVGDTGLVRKRGRYASHLHLEVYIHGRRVNPLYFFM
jgi:murein DD-endopeptidase MepM/ murein hydrolase activator NlpD